MVQVEGTNKKPHPFNSLSKEKQEQVSAEARRIVGNEILEATAQAKGVARFWYGEGKVSRRNMLGAAGLTSLAYFVSGSVWREMFKEEESEAANEKEKAESAQKENYAETNENKSHERSLFITGLKIGSEAFLMRLGERFLTFACINLGIRVGNAGLISRKEVQRHEVDKLVKKLEQEGEEFSQQIFTSMCIKGPFYEEVICRMIPSGLLRDNKRHWEIGIPSAILFALVHNITDPKKSVDFIPLTENKAFSLDWLPLPQFLAGVFYWYLVREYGIFASVPMHMLRNFIPAKHFSNGMYLATKRIQSVKDELAKKELDLSKASFGELS